MLLVFVKAFKVCLLKSSLKPLNNKSITMCTRISKVLFNNVVCVYLLKFLKNYLNSTLNTLHTMKFGITFRRSFACTLLKDQCSFANVTTRARRPLLLEKSNGCIKRYLDCCESAFISLIFYMS